LHQRVVTIFGRTLGPIEHLLLAVGTDALMH
jgi:hypothetical protein